MRDFRDLKVWEKAHQLVLALYRATASYPTEERYGLTSQMRRAAVSVPSNVAEGCGRNTQPDLRRFLEISSGSASEVEYQFLLSHDLGFLTEDTYRTLNQGICEVKRMLTALIVRINEES